MKKPRTAMPIAPIIALLVALTVAAAALPTPGARAAGVGIRWGFYVTYNPNSLQSLQANVGKLTHVSPWYFNLNADGRITGNDQAAASSLIRNAGAKNLPMIKNSSAEYDAFSALVNNPEKVNSIVDQIDTLVTNNNYDGITLDFEALNPSDKTQLTILFSRVYDRLHPKGKLTVGVVAAKTRDISTGWAAAYDYPAIGRVVDYVMVMAYDYSYTTGDPGPIAPLSKLRDTATYTLARIPAGQVIWGVGVYGYDWPVGLDGKATGRADARTWAEADAITRQSGATSGYDNAAHAPWARYTLNGVPRHVWYEDQRSFDAKMELVGGRGMAGFALWRLGQEDPRIWNSITTLPTPVPVTPTPPRFPTNPAGTPYVPPTATAPPPTATATPTPKPIACNSVPPITPTDTKIYFPETRHTLGGAFLKYWRQYGGLPVYGYPITEEFTEKSPTDGKPYTVQYFERNRFEYHPENAPPNHVQLGLLGVQTIGPRTFPPPTDPQLGLNTVYFPQVGHTLGDTFLAYWQEHGALRQFGYPLSEPVLEKSAIDGKTYTVQYFERARFELHPEHAGTPYEVLLGLLGLNVWPCK
ncbi:MAG: glycosyl hydrolase family 18 protein [Chloroflexia bacterium]